MTIDQFNSLTKNCNCSTLTISQTLREEHCFCIFAMNRSQIIQTSCTWSNLPTNELLQCLTKHLYVILCCVKIHTIFPLFCRPNLLKVIPTRWNGTLSFTSFPKRLLFLPLYRGLAVPQSPTMVRLTYCEITDIREFFDTGSHPRIYIRNKFWNSIFVHSWNYVHTNL